jgi:hypothetical protein
MPQRFHRIELRYFYWGQTPKRTPTATETPKLAPSAQAGTAGHTPAIR